MEKTSVPLPSPPSPPLVTVSRLHFWLFNMGSSFAVRQPDTTLGSQRKENERARGRARQLHLFVLLQLLLPIVVVVLSAESNFPTCLLSRLLPFLTLLSIFGFCFCFCLFWVALLAVVVLVFVLLLVVVLCFTGTLVFLVYLSELIALFSYNFRTLAACSVANSSHSSAQSGPHRRSCHAEVTGYTCTGTPREHCAAAAAAALTALLCTVVFCRQAAQHDRNHQLQPQQPTAPSSSL